MTCDDLLSTRCAIAGVAFGTLSPWPNTPSPVDAGGVQPAAVVCWLRSPAPSDVQAAGSMPCSRTWRPPAKLATGREDWHEACDELRQPLQC